MSKAVKTSTFKDHERLRSLTSEQLTNLQRDVDELKEALLRLELDTFSVELHPPYDEQAFAAATQILRVRREREQVFGSDFFGEPAWEILLQLLLAELRQIRTSATKICDAAQVPPTTASRWLSRLIDAGWVEQQSDPLDARRTWVALSRRGTAAMRLILQSHSRKE